MKLYQLLCNTHVNKLAIIVPKKHIKCFFYCITKQGRIHYSFNIHRKLRKGKASVTIIEERDNIIAK